MTSDLIFVILFSIPAMIGLGMFYSSWKLCPLARATKRLMRDDPDGWVTDEIDYGYHEEMNIRIRYSRPRWQESCGTIQINDVKLDVLEGYRIRESLRKLRGRKIIRDFKQSQQKRVEELERKKAAEIDAILESR